MSDLKDALQDIDGVGPATADDIMSVLDDHAPKESESRLLEKAREAALNGDDRQAGVWLRRDSAE